MIDIHAHILPAIDDGAKDLKESVEILQKLEKQGVTDVIATPHVMAGTYNNDIDIIQQKLGLVQEAILKNNMKINIYPGAELYMDSNIVAATKNNKLNLCFSRYVLVESSFQHFPKNFEEILFNFQQEGYTPIIAHAERFNNFNNNFNYLVEILNRGCYVQMNCGSIFGEYGNHVKKFAHKLLNEGCVHFLASDLHGIEVRPIIMKETYIYIKKNYSEALAELLLKENPRRVLTNKPIKSMIADTYWENEGREVGFFQKLKDFFK